jgi:hypothetical protein
VLTDAVGRCGLAIDQKHQPELVGQFVDGGAVEVGQEDAFFAVVFYDPPAGRLGTT